MSAVISARLEAQVEGIQSEASPGQTHETLPEKLLKQKEARCISQVALSSSPSTAPKKDLTIT